jgi:hypothetical protein
LIGENGKKSDVQQQAELYYSSEEGRFSASRFVVSWKARLWLALRNQLADIGWEKVARKCDVQQKIRVVLIFIKRVSSKACFSASIVRSLWAGATRKVLGVGAEGM